MSNKLKWFKTQPTKFELRADSLGTVGILQKDYNDSYWEVKLIHKEFVLLGKLDPSTTEQDALNKAHVLITTYCNKIIYDAMLIRDNLPTYGEGAK